MTQFNNTIEILAQMMREEQDIIDYHIANNATHPELVKTRKACEARVAEYQAAIKLLQDAQA